MSKVVINYTIPNEIPEWFKTKIKTENKNLGNISLEAYISKRYPDIFSKYEYIINETIKRYINGANWDIAIYLNDIRKYAVISPNEIYALEGIELRKLPLEQSNNLTITITHIYSLTHEQQYNYNLYERGYTDINSLNHDSKIHPNDLKFINGTFPDLLQFAKVDIIAEYNSYIDGLNTQFEKVLYEEWLHYNYLLIDSFN